MFSPFEVSAPQPAPRVASAWRCSVCDHVHEGDAPPERCPICGAKRTGFDPHSPRESPAVRPDVERVVIVGAGIAGLTAAEHARLASSEVGITLVSEEAGLPYYRLNLTRHLAGEVTEESLAVHGEQWYADRRIDLVHGEAASIDCTKREVRLGDGGVLPYDRLVLATGAHAFVPPIPGVARDGVVTFRTLEDTRSVLAAAASSRRWVCIGGGLLGLETAGALKRKGLEVTVIEGFDSLLPRQLAEPAGRLLQGHLEGLGLKVRCGVSIDEIAGDERVRGVRLKGDEELAADVVVLGTGVRPHSHLARQSGIEVDKGVLVDDRMFTSDPAVLAAGDVAEHRGVLYGIWPASYAQGVIAGTNAVGGNIEFTGLAPSNRLKVLDVDLFSIGQFQPPDGSYEVIEHQEHGVYLRLVCRDGRLVGANLYGETRLAGPITDAIEKGTPLAASAEILAGFPRAELTDRCRR